MAEVYENGVLNISAALGPDAEYGCFHDRYYFVRPKNKRNFPGWSKILSSTAKMG